MVRNLDPRSVDILNTKNNCYVTKDGYVDGDGRHKVCNTRKVNIENKKNDRENSEIDRITEIKFSDFFRLLLRISEIVYPEIFNMVDETFSTHVTNSTDITALPLSGPSCALDKIMRVSTSVRSCVETYCILSLSLSLSL